MPGHVLGPNTDFDGLLLENRIFSEQMTNTKVVAKGLYYLSVQFQLIPMLQTRDNGQKPSKMAYNCL